MKSGVIDGYLYYNASSGTWGIVSEGVSSGSTQPTYGVLSSTSSLRSSSSTSEPYGTNNYVQFNDEIEINDAIIFNGYKFNSYTQLLQIFQDQGLFYNSLYFDGGGLGVNFSSINSINSDTNIDLKIGNISKLNISSTQVETTTDLKVSKIIFGDNTELTTASTGSGGGLSYPLSEVDTFEVNVLYKSTDEDTRFLFVPNSATIIYAPDTTEFRIASNTKLSINNTSIVSAVDIFTPAVVFNDGSSMNTAPTFNGLRFIIKSDNSSVNTEWNGIDYVTRWAYFSSSYLDPAFQNYSTSDYTLSGTKLFILKAGFYMVGYNMYYRCDISDRGSIQNYLYIVNNGSISYECKTYNYMRNNNSYHTRTSSNNASQIQYFNANTEIRLGFQRNANTGQITLDNENWSPSDIFIYKIG